MKVSGSREGRALTRILCILGGSGFDHPRGRPRLALPTPPTFHLVLTGFTRLIDTRASIALSPYLRTGIYNSDPTLIHSPPEWEFSGGGLDRSSRFIDDPSVAA